MRSVFYRPTHHHTMLHCIHQHKTRKLSVIELIIDDNFVVLERKLYYGDGGRHHDFIGRVTVDETLGLLYHGDVEVTEDEAKHLIKKTQLIGL